MLNTVVDRHYRDNHKKLIKVVSRRLDNNKALAEEAVQEAYTKALEGLKDFHAEKSFNSWFTSILNNVVRDVQNTERGRGVIRRNEAFSLIFDGIYEPPYDWEQFIKTVEKDIATVKNPVQRHILTLYFLKRLQPREIVALNDLYNLKLIDNLIQRFKKALQERYS